MVSMLLFGLLVVPSLGDETTFNVWPSTINNDPSYHIKSTMGNFRHVVTLLLSGSTNHSLTSIIISEDGSKMLAGLTPSHYIEMPAPAKESSINASVHELPHPKSPRATSDYGQIEVLTMNGVYKGELKGEFYAGYENDIIVKYPNGLQGEVIDVLYNGDLKHKCRSDRQGAILKLRTSLAGWCEESVCRLGTATGSIDEGEDVANGVRHIVRRTPKDSGSIHRSPPEFVVASGASLVIRKESTAKYARRAYLASDNKYEGLAINEDPVTNELSIYVLKRSLAVNGEANSFVAKFMRMTTSTATPTSVLVTLELPESDSYAIRSPFIHVLLTTVLIILAAIVSY